MRSRLTATFGKMKCQSPPRALRIHFASEIARSVYCTLQSGAEVVTVEPIVQFPDKRMHFRVEDTILITSGAPEILSAGVPKETSEVEKLVGSAR